MTLVGAGRLDWREVEASTHPMYPHSGHPGFARTVPPPWGFVYRAVAGETPNGLPVVDLELSFMQK